MRFNVTKHLDDYSINQKLIDKLYNKFDFQDFGLFIHKLNHCFKTDVFMVGGCVRDLFLEKESKDIDLIIPGIEINDLIDLLNQFGTANLVGQSFGVIKFKPTNSEEIFDIAVPRIEKNIGSKHTDFEVKIGSEITIEEDLKRRDFTMNAIALNFSGFILDPFNGIDDIQRKMIRSITDNSFQEDPLRILRALQFASRFNFSIENNTSKQISLYKNLIRNISGERILIEFEKGIKNNTACLFARNLVIYGLFEEIFGIKPLFKDLGLTEVKTIAEFLFVTNISLSAASNILKVSNQILEELRSLHLIEYSIENSKNDVDVYKTIFACLKRTPEILETKVLINEKDFFIPFLNGTFPKSFKELKINGNDILKTGLKGENIGLFLKSTLDWIFSGAIKNEREELLQFLYSTTKLINNVKFD